MTLQPTRRRFSIDEYYQMAEVGILSPDDRVELIDGEIIEMAPIGRRHAAGVDRLIPLFLGVFGALVHLRVQNPVRLGDYSEPEPDVALLRPRADYYASGHPGPADVLLVVEVAETSLMFDRRRKVPLYARSGIPDVWLVDLRRRTLSVYRDPTPDGYRTVRTLRPGDMIATLAFPDRPLSVAAVLGTE
jgi:Uma2 family endonuclease